MEKKPNKKKRKTTIQVYTYDWGTHVFGVEILTLLGAWQLSIYTISVKPHSEMSLWELPSQSPVDAPDQRHRQGLLFLLSVHFSWSANPPGSRLPNVSSRPGHNRNANYFLIAIKPHHENLTQIRTPNEIESFSIGLRTGEVLTDIITSLRG